MNHQNAIKIEYFVSLFRLRNEIKKVLGKKHREGILRQKHRIKLNILAEHQQIFQRKPDSPAQ